MTTVVLVGETGDLDAVASLLGGTHGFDVLLLPDPAELEEASDDIVCVVCGPDVIDGPFLEEGNRGVANCAWIALYRDGETAIRALSLGIDRCIQYGTDRTVTATHLANAIETAIDRRRAAFARVHSTD